MSAAANIRELVCGYAKRRWGELPLAMINVYADDSIIKNGKGRLFIASWINSAEAWIEFSDDWDSCLRAAPSINYLKMTEATRRQEQFRGWSEKSRNRKLLALADVIRKYRPKGFFTSIDVRDFNSLVKPYAPYPMDRPYSLAYSGIILGIPRIIPASMSGKIRLIFDRQDGMPARIDPIFDSLFSQAPDEWRDRYIGPPQFEDDKRIVPLQAADMLVWLLRREAEFGLEQEYSDIRNAVISDADIAYTEIGKDTLQKFSDEYKNMPVLKQIGKKEWRDMSDIYARTWHQFR